MKDCFRFDIIKDFIAKSRISRTKFCKLCGISISEFRKMERGDNSFKFESLCKIALKLDIDMINFFIPILSASPVYYIGCK